MGCLMPGNLCNLWNVDKFDNKLHFHKHLWFQPCTRLWISFSVSNFKWTNTITVLVTFHIFIRSFSFVCLWSKLCSLLTWPLNLILSLYWAIITLKCNYKWENHTAINKHGYLYTKVAEPSLKTIMNCQHDWSPFKCRKVRIESLVTFWGQAVQ